MRRWLRRVPPDHVHCVYTQADQQLIAIAVEGFGSIRYPGNLLHHTLTVLAANAFHAKRRFGLDDAPWALIGIYTQGQLLAPPGSG